MSLDEGEEGVQGKGKNMDHGEEKERGKEKVEKVLVTGAAGFIGFFTVLRLLQEGRTVVGLDDINAYYDVEIKYGRLRESGIERNKVAYGALVQSTTFAKYRFVQMGLEDQEGIDDLFATEKFGGVVNLAAQAGVRHSLLKPRDYMRSNLSGFLNILEACRACGVRHLVYASSSSVYGMNRTMPFSTHHSVTHPVSLYAATKASNELMAHSYSHLFRIPCTGLRFFTVYGPWGRPDMALFYFTKSIIDGKPIRVFNHGDMSRDFTYVDDIVEGVVRVLDRPPAANPAWDAEAADPGTSSAPYRVYNIGNSKPVQLMDFVTAIEKAVGKTAEKEMLPMQPGDVKSTYADTTDLERDVGYKPSTELQEGVDKFVAWYKDFYDIKMDGT